MIDIAAVHKTFNKGRANEVAAIKNLSVKVHDKEFLVVVGSNGSGKSTLLNLIAGSILPDSGTITIAANNVTRLPDYTRSRWVARVFQNPLSGTAPDLSVIDNFRLAAIRTQPKGFTIGTHAAFKKEVQARIATLGMGLENKIEQPMGTLSGGQRQALTLLMSVTDNCKVLLLDEPTAALDPRSAEVVMQTAQAIIKEHALTAILITHNLKDAHTYGNRIIQMAEGVVIKDISALQKAQLTLNQLFGWFA